MTKYAGVNRCAVCKRMCEPRIRWTVQIGAHVVSGDITWDGNRTVCSECFAKATIAAPSAAA